MENKLPPQDISAEMAILGGIFLDNSAIDIVHGILSHEDFYRENHRKIFTAMAELADKNEPIDLVTLSAALKKSEREHLEESVAYLAILVDYVPTSANIAYYCRLVAEKSAARRLLSALHVAQPMIYQGDPLPVIVGELEKAIQLPDARKKLGPVSARDIMRETVKTLERRFESKGIIQGIPYGINGLDTATDGMHRGELIVVAGRPSMGKTSFALNVLEHICGVGLNGLMFSLEMSRQNNMDKILASQGRVRYQNIRNGHFADSDWQKIINAAGTVNNWGLYLDDTPAVSLAEIRSKLRRLKKTGLDVVVIDYLQLMSMPGKESRTQAIGEVSRGLKQLARELDIVVIAVSQLSRAVDSRTDKRPVMSDLRDSGEIEQDADVILFPYRPAAYCQLCKDRVENGEHNYWEHQAKAEIIIEKQRNGERNISIPLAWLGEYQRFIGVA